MKIKNYKKITNLSFKFKKYYFKENIIVWVIYFLKKILNFILILQFITKLMNMFNYSIITHFIPLVIKNTIPIVILIQCTKVS